MERKCPLVNEQVYHVFNRSIADFKIFNLQGEFERMLKLIYFFRSENPSTKFSTFINSKSVHDLGFWEFCDSLTGGNNNIVQLIAYCLMPTHIHLVLKQLKNNGISTYVGNVLNSYTRFFNCLHKRKGPLWESKFRNISVDSDEQLLHLTRYLHLNAVTAKIVEKPEDWHYSSYLEYLSCANICICDFRDILTIDPAKYKDFVNDRIGYQQELAVIKKQIIET